MKAEILIDDVLGRWKKGDIGEVLENDSDKYDYFIDLGKMELPPNNVLFDAEMTHIPRIYYFYAADVRVYESLKMSLCVGFYPKDCDLMNDMCDHYLDGECTFFDIKCDYTIGDKL